MKSFNYILLFISICFLFNLDSSAFAQEQEIGWTGTLKDGQKINKNDLKRILQEADLRKGILAQAKLQGARLWGANLQKANLDGANLQEADLLGAFLQEANLVRAKLQGARLWDAKLQGARLWGANLQKANLFGANLQGADLDGANLQEATLGDANLKGTIFEIKPKALPYIPDIAEALNLSQLKYKRSPHALVELRRAFREAGLRKQERAITYAIKRSGFENTLSNIDAAESYKDIDYTTLVEVCFGWLFIEVTCDWGMAPLRPLGILSIFIGLFTIPYTVSITIRKKKDGIWKVWIPERVRTDLGKKQPEVIRFRGFKALRAAFYFSVLSAFNIGWRDLNVGGWITKIQPREYRLQATGWVRSVSGFQSLISVYLLALSFLTHFGRPFESY